MPRPRTPIGSHGAITVAEISPGRWRARTRYRFEDGKLRQLERFAPSKAKAVAAIKSASASLASAGGVETKRETKLRDLAERFLTSKADRAPRTVEAYTHSARRVIVPRIGDVSVMEATPERLQRFLDTVRLEHGPGAAKTARAVLSGMMGLAARSDAIRQNPVRELEAVKGRAKGAQPVPIDELAGLLEAVRADERLVQLDLVDVVEFVAGTGVRISEALGLAWADVDLAAGTVVVRANVVRAKGLGVVRQEHTKTEAGSRRIKLPGALVGILGDRRVRGGPNDEGLVFPTVLGKRRDPRAVAREWAAARQRVLVDAQRRRRDAAVRARDEAGAGGARTADALEQAVVDETVKLDALERAVAAGAPLPAYTFHSFRKTVATALDQAGLTPRDIAEYLGHADPSLTMGVYMSKTVGGSRAADALDGVLGHLSADG